MAQGSPGHNPQGGQILVLRGGWVVSGSAEAYAPVLSLLEEQV